MPETTHDDVTISFSDQGTGPPALLVHGHTLDRRVFDPVIPALLGAGSRVIRPDLRGHGRSSRPDSGYHVSHHAEDMAAVLDAVGLDRAAVIGFSFGGAVALELAVTRPELITGLGLIASVMPDRPFEPTFMDSLREVARVVRADGVPAAMAGPWDRCPLFEHSFTKPGVRAAVAAMVKDFPGAEFLATERDRVDRDWSLPDRLGEIAVPTRIMVGEREMPGFRGYSDEAAEKIPGASLEIVPDGGHILPLEEPGSVAAMVVDLLLPETR
jgi:pimeloyl-ACP methyl ester carboxylesterase